MTWTNTKKTCCSREEISRGYMLKDSYVRTGKNSLKVTGTTEVGMGKSCLGWVEMSCLDWDGNYTGACLQQDFKLDTTSVHFTVSNYINNYLQKLQRKRQRS